MPALLPATGYIISSLSDPDLELAALPRILEAVPSVAGRLVGLANSAWSSPVSEVTSLQLACSRLGLNMVRTVSIALTVAEPFSVRHCPEFESERFWRSSLIAADAGSALAQTSPSVDEATIRTAALLSRLGILWLAENDAQRLSAGLLTLKEDPEASLQACLQDSGGPGHAEVSAELARAWQLPGKLVDAIEAQHHPGEGVDVSSAVGLALGLCRHLTRGAALPGNEHASAPVSDGALEELRNAMAARSELARCLVAS